MNSSVLQLMRGSIAFQARFGARIGVNHLNRRQLNNAIWSRRRFFSTEDGSPSKAYSWRKEQLGKVQERFDDPMNIEREEDLQSMWREMESRVSNRKPRTVKQNGGRTGRRNIRKTDEELWLKEGAYAHLDTGEEKST